MTLMTALFIINLSIAACDTTYPCIDINTFNEELSDYSKNRNTNYEKLTTDKLLDYSNDYIGVPYKYGGDSLQGIDCSAFTRVIYKRIGINLPRTSRMQYKDQRFKNIYGQLQIFDLLFFKNSPNEQISHVAIYLGNGNIIHSSRREGGVYISNYNKSKFWKKIFFKAKRLRIFFQEGKNEESFVNNN